MLVETLVKGSDAGPRMLSFEAPPSVGDYVYVRDGEVELMYVVGARFWRLTEKEEEGMILGKATRVRRRQHTLFIGIELVSSVELMLAANGLQQPNA
jgi:hypothetical protein